MCRRSPERIRIEICISARSSKPACDNISILASVVESLAWSAANRLDVWVLASHIEYISLSRRKESSEISEYVEMNSPISVIFSANDTLSSQRSKHVHNCPVIKVVSGLSVGEEDISTILEVETWHVPNRKVLWKVMLSKGPRDKGHPQTISMSKSPRYRPGTMTLFCYLTDCHCTANYKNASPRTDTLPAQAKELHPKKLPSFKRENATLSESPTRLPKDVNKNDPQQNVDQKA